jgi:hypothetical protein
MNFANFCAQLIRGWLPEEPKMPKHTFRRMRTPIAVWAVATTVVSLFSFVFLFGQSAALLPPPLTVQSAPNTSFVEFKGVLQQNNSFIMVLTDGTHITSKNLTLTFLINEESDNRCRVHLDFECDSFAKEKSVDGSIVDRSLVVDSRRSLFLINPNATKTRNVVLTEAHGHELRANMDARMGHPSTAVEPYGVTAQMVSSTQPHYSGLPMYLILGYDPDTGILLYSGYSLTDVLLEKLGIELLLGGSLKLVSYSENLNLEFFNWSTFWARVSFTGIFFYSQMVLFAAISSVVTVRFVIRKIRERRRTAALGISVFRDGKVET